MPGLVKTSGVWWANIPLVKSSGVFVPVRCYEKKSGNWQAKLAPLQVFYTSGSISVLTCPVTHFSSGEFVTGNSVAAAVTIVTAGGGEGIYVWVTGNVSNTTASLHISEYSQTLNRTSYDAPNNLTQYSASLNATITNIHNKIVATGDGNYLGGLIVFT